MRLTVNLVVDTETDSLLVQVPAAEGEGDVTLLTLDLKALSTEDKRKLRHVRPVDQVQRPPGSQAVTRGGA